jgi:hypothetical protein
MQNNLYFYIDLRKCKVPPLYEVIMGFLLKIYLYHSYIYFAKII